jgi:hypothetical protein
MIDDQKTAAFRERIKKEKNSKDAVENNEETAKKDLNPFASILTSAGHYFALYGSQWVILSKLGVQPFSLLESLILLFGLKFFIKK